MRVEERRGDLTETVHRVHVAVVDADGALVARAGDPGLVTFWRSAAKPFQAMPLVADGAAERFDFSDAELALCCASHSSEPGQVETVRALLAKIGCREDDLRCGPHTPLAEHVARDYQARGVRLTPVYSNCSGKHTGMLALARHHEWPTADYHRLAHPVQDGVAMVEQAPAGNAGQGTERRLMPRRAAVERDGIVDSAVGGAARLLLASRGLSGWGTARPPNLEGLPQRHTGAKQTQNDQP